MIFPEALQLLAQRSTRPTAPPTTGFEELEDSLPGMAVLGKFPRYFTSVLATSKIKEDGQRLTDIHGLG